MSAVYIMEAVGFPYVKIGHTRDLETRLVRISQQVPFEVRVIGIVKGTERDEGELHRQCATWRVRGEWFEKAPELLELVRATVARGTIEHVTRKCVDCGRLRSTARGKRCRKCEGDRRRREAAAAAKPKRCVDCGKVVSRQNVTGVCRSCGMRRAWARPDYQASIMQTREAAGVRRRKKCERCGEPLSPRGNRFHAECWQAELADRRARKAVP